MASSAWRTASASTHNGACAEVGAWRKSAASGGGVGNGENCAEVGAWRKAERSMGNGNCAEVSAWRKSPYSINDAGAGSECAEVGTGDAVVGVRDTKEEQRGEGRTVLEFTPGAWGRFLAQLRQQ